MENNGIHVIAFEDDASRKILSIGEFNNSTTDNALEVLKGAELEAMEVNGLLQAIDTDRGSQFYPNKKDKNGDADSVFRDYLESKCQRRCKITQFPRFNFPHLHIKLPLEIINTPVSSRSQVPYRIPEC